MSSGTSMSLSSWRTETASDGKIVPAEELSPPWTWTAMVVAAVGRSKCSSISQADEAGRSVGAVAAPTVPRLLVRS